MERVAHRDPLDQGGEDEAEAHVEGFAGLGVGDRVAAGQQQRPEPLAEQTHGLCAAF